MGERAAKTCTCGRCSFHGGRWTVNLSGMGATTLAQHCPGECGDELLPGGATEPRGDPEDGRRWNWLREQHEYTWGDDAQIVIGSSDETHTDGPEFGMSYIEIPRQFRNERELIRVQTDGGFDGLITEAMAATRQHDAAREADDAEQS